MLPSSGFSAMSRFGFTQNVHHVNKLELHAETGSIQVIRAGTEMEQCQEMFAFVEMFMTGNSAPVVQRGMLCGKKQDIHEKVEDPGPTHCFLCGQWRQCRNQYGRACRGDLLCGTRQ